MKKNIGYTVIAVCFSLFNSMLKAYPIERIFVKGGEMKYHHVNVIVSSFEISKYEITNKQYAGFLNEKNIGPQGILGGIKLINVGSNELQVEYKNEKWMPKPGYENYPMVMVNYYGAVDFCNWIGGKLPTEIEWTYAAKGGTKSKNYTYAGGNIFDEVGWYKDNSEQHSHPVGEKKPNELGIYDMSGNAWEWCLNDTLKLATGFCVHMGGSWYATEQPGRIDAHYGNVPTHFSNSVGFRAVFPADSVMLDKRPFRNYKGKSWNNEPQQIPGKIQCEFYDIGGEGIAYHDTDSINNGSGKLNPANGTFLNEFRIKEGVDISFTKTRDIDNNPYNMVEPKMDQLYVGWTMPGEWINYTIKVNKTGNYTVRLMYTASGDGGILLLLDGNKLTNELLIPSTRNDKEPIAWRQWHHWNRIDSLATVKLKKGIHVLTLKTVTNGNMNYDFLELKLEN
ncbi:SUMF1/EgtB/PvdO family nonheme iron enzyme [Ginsengibacter hankyongi]|uniref:SUMF1/EgtB/PvdO family nonheme iron enzyme n=1 Tax=Ginsengibacter hankyongi TaxID=2607284 RepID=A0A5J5IEQ8_9BACT|nr:SUMF1/EgtB/PvdO family nonheme iron enzyme [Ginsengibacter hankyongi]KAA9037773.1 SUMF1/EgtB/PvdO family nonheme iron enzyme [Ginsengibacter hankyongi]